MLKPGATPLPLTDPKDPMPRNQAPRSIRLCGNAVAVLHSNAWASCDGEGRGHGRRHHDGRGHGRGHGHGHGHGRGHGHHNGWDNDDWGNWSSNWDDDDLHALGRVPTSAFEVVDTENAPPPPPPTGPTVAWAFSLPGGNIYRVAPTADGGFCVAGDFSGTVDFDPGTGVRTLTAAGTYDVTWQATPAQGAQLWLVAVE